MSAFKLNRADGAGQPSALDPMTLPPLVIGNAAVDSAIMVDGLIDQRPTQMLVDTGSAVTIVREDTWQSAVGGSKQLFLPPRPVVAANGEELEVLGLGEVTLQVGGLRTAHTVLVTRGVTQECLLGADFLSHHHCVVDLGKRLLLAGGKSVPFQIQKPHHISACHVTLKETTVIPGQYEMQLPVCLDSPKIDYTGVFEPAPKFTERHGLFVAHSISSSQSGETLVRVVNPSSAPITVRQHEKVGKFQPLDDTDEVCLLEAAKEQNESNKEPSIVRKAEITQAIQQLVSGVKGLTSHQLAELHSLLGKYIEVISLRSGDLGRTSVIRHKINTQGASPIRQPARRLPFHQRNEVRQMLDQMLQQDIIEPAHGPWSSPIVLVKKKDGSTRFCVDFRRLNDLTRKDAQPLPRIDDTLDALTGACWFSTLDLASGYWQVEVDPDDREKTAFVTPFGIHQFRVMPFGLCNAPGTFQRLMELVLAGLNWTTCLVYLDDIIIFSRTVEEHLQRLQEILERLKNAGLKLKPSKCHLLRKSVKYLGHVISEHGVETDPEKTASVAKWSTPTDLKELRQFLGLASYYRRFVKNFSQIAAPLFQLTHKGKHWCWNQECEEAFVTLKSKLTTAPVLIFPSFDQEFILDTDASGNGLGAVLSQQINGSEQVVGYSSRTLTKAERRYCATRREMLALVWGTRQFRPYLYGRHFKARTDHNSLRWLRNFREPEGQVARWLEILAEFDFDVIHRPGKQHGNADSLSRGHCQQCGEDMELTLDLGSNVVMESTDNCWTPRWTTGELIRLQKADPDTQQMAQWINEGTLPERYPQGISHRLQTLWMQRQHLVIHNEVLYRRWEDVQGGGLNKRLQLVLPQALVPSVLTELHNSSTAGHQGVKKTLEKVRTRFYWPGQRQDVEHWCQRCDDCASRKLPVKHRRAPMQIGTAGKPMQRIAMDILGPLPETDRLNKYVLVVGDYFTKWTEAFPLPNMEAETVARRLLEFICRNGAPEYLHTDQGRNFESNLVQELCRLLGITKTRTTPYHPQSDGMVERFNRTLLNMLSLSVQDNERDWDLHLPSVMLAYRTSVHETTGETPFQLMFGREVRLPIDVMYGTPTGEPPASTNQYAQSLRNRLEKAYRQIRSHTKLMQKRQKEVYDRHLEGSPYQVGDSVWLHCPAIPRGRSRKFHRPWQGPFEVIKVISDVVYRIRRCSSPRQRLVVHFNRLKPYTGQPNSDHPPNPAPTLVYSQSQNLPGPVLTPGNDASSDNTTEHLVSGDAEQARDDQGSEENENDTSGNTEETVQLRRSTRQRQPPDRYGDYVSHSLLMMRA